MSILKDTVVKKSKNKTTAEWLQCIHNLKKVALATHIGKFFNPNSAVFINIDDDEHLAHRGYIMSAACQVQQDVAYGNSSDMGPIALIMLKLEDGKTVYDHLLAGDADVIQEFAEMGLPPDELMSAFNDFVNGKSAYAFDMSFTEQNLKQIYFPIDSEKQEDHILTIVPASSLAETITRKLEDIKQATIDSKNSKEPTYGAEHVEIHDVTIKRSGGSQPQNVSYNNSQLKNMRLLNSLPPVLEKKNLRYPKEDFFEILPKALYEDFITTLRELMSVPVNNKNVRQGIIHTIKALCNVIISYSKLYHKEPGWSKNPIYKELGKHYRKMLDPTMYDPLTEKERDAICNGFAQWIKKILETPDQEHKAYSLADADVHYLKDIMKDVLKETKV